MDNSSKINQFKEFVKNNPFLIHYIKNKEKSWQDMYEIYDLYGEDEEVWQRFLEKDDRVNHSSLKSSNYFEEFVKMAKNIDVNKVQEGITSLQKTLGLFGELFSGHNGDSESTTYQPRPLYRRFED